MSDSVEQAVAALEDYLRRYPSGNFAELAQVRLDQLLAQRGEQKAAIASAVGNPFTKGTSVANIDVRVGDRYFFSIIELTTGQSRQSLQVVNAVRGSEIVYGDGRLITDLLGNIVQMPPGLTFANHQTFPAEYFVGKKWISRYQVTNPYGLVIEESIEYAVVDREKIELQAGTFDAYRVEGSGWSSVVKYPGVVHMSMQGGKRVYKYWMAPERARRHLVFESYFWDRNGVPERKERLELRWFSEAR